MPQSSSSIVDLLQAGIRAEGYRQQAIASNIANLETPGYRRTDVKFEDLLAEALKTEGDVDLDEIEPEPFHPGNTPVKSNGNDVSLDMEVGELLKNSLRHTAYVRLLNRKFQQIDQAINIR
ncbi:MAG: flagellar basal body rod protein FlgB [Sedimentisphaerales bacterium]|nr:flagellar basal body rod protein FlgB [Sedimentisphaerales bacterium]